MELEVLAKNEAASWRQKSRVFWLKQGDNSTKFFQRIATAHRRHNTIDRLVVRGEEVQDLAKIKVTMIDFYKDLYRESQIWRPFELLDCPRFSREEQKWLERPFTEAEVLKIVKQCDRDKASGPDGFTMNFFKTCWEILIKDLM